MVLMLALKWKSKLDEQTLIPGGKASLFAIISVNEVCVVHVHVCNNENVHCTLCILHK